MSLHFWKQPAVLKDWWKPPKLSWWFEPSGGDCAPPKPWGLMDYILESPLGAHSLGALLIFVVTALALLLPFEWACSVVAFAVCVYGQGQKGDALIPLKRYNLRNVVWRSIIGGVASFGLGFILSLFL